ncbi:SH3 domain-containing protein [Treponema sp.]|uniref:SH3 domain-containing protein n=1 Tax=Treponema sp. TaxID=166 RepID=UPI003F110C95
MKNKVFLFAFSLFVMFFSSCSGVIGYGVVLWNVSEKEIPDGTVVPVYLKSNISKVYVIGVPGTKEKIEIPLWKLSNPESKSRAVKYAKKYSEYTGKYAFCIFDGLPVRADKVNTSKQVYRLKKNEVVRALYKGNGVAPTSGGNPLPGEWLRVLTDGGIEGWCFSYNLRLFDMNRDGSYGAGAEVVEVQQKDETLDKILFTYWYPEYYRPMISKKQIDLEYILPGYGFDSGYISGTTKISLPNLNVSFPYSEFEKMDNGDYRAKDAPVEIIPRSSKYIIVRYIDDSGKPRNYTFTSLEDDVRIEELISEEKSRRQGLYKSIQALGPDFKSGNYGTLSFNDNNIFRWSGFMKLVPAVIPQGAKGIGFVETKYFLDGTLKSSWDGVVTFHFENASREVNFLYKKEVNGLRLAYANIVEKYDDSFGRKTVSVSLPANSMVLFFQK